MKKALKICGAVLLCLLVIVGAALGVLTIAEYRPADTETLIADRQVETVLRTGEPLTLVSWNLGYGALGANADFFMDGGSHVYTADKAGVEANLAGIREALQTLSPDLLLLQEMDIGSDRSHRIDQRTALRDVVEGAEGIFAYNFNSLYVPFPLPPIGHVESGLYTLSRAPARQAERLSLPCPFSWPLRIANLKRCLLVTRIPVEGTEKELVLINLHLEAYDSGEGKVAQTRRLAELLQAERARGNYVIAGGDFNQCFTSVDASLYPVMEGEWTPGEIAPADLGEGFTALMDPSAPTCRSLRTPYAGERDGFQFYMIDGFVVSDNIGVREMNTVDLDFACTDHNPVRLVFEMKAE